MIFRSNKSNCQFNTDLKINNQTTRVESTNVLGITTDKYLTWREHINTVKKLISTGFGITCKARISCISQYIMHLYTLT